MDQPNPSLLHPSLVGKHILLAEDSLTLQRLIGSILQHSRVHTTTACTGQEAFDLAMSQRDQGQPFDLILMDVVMPELNGCDATFKLRQAGYAGKIIILTAADVEFDLARALCAGADDFLAKPFSPQQLTTMLLLHMGKNAA